MKVSGEIHFFDPFSAGLSFPSNRHAKGWAVLKYDSRVKYLLSLYMVPFLEAEVSLMITL